MKIEKKSNMQKFIVIYVILALTIVGCIARTTVLSSECLEICDIELIFAPIIILRYCCINRKKIFIFKFKILFYQKMMCRAIRWSDRNANLGDAEVKEVLVEVMEDMAVIGVNPGSVEVLEDSVEDRQALWEDKALVDQVWAETTAKVQLKQTRTHSTNTWDLTVSAQAVPLPMHNHLTQAAR